MAIAAVLLVASGASCHRLLEQYTQPYARALPIGPTIEQVMNVVNANGGGVESLYAARATINTPGAPTALKAKVAYQRDRHFRLTAETGLSGREMDLGSNDELFWFWVKRNQPPAVYFCRHDQYAASAARQILPVDPNWLPRALGIVTLDPTATYQGPVPISAGRLEIRTLPATPGGTTLITVVDASKGIVLEEHVYDSAGNRLATALLSEHLRDGTTGITLPQHVVLQFPPTGLAVTIDLKEIQVNRLQPLQSELWVKPTFGAAYPEVDLANPNLRLEPTARGGMPHAPGQDQRY